MKYILLAMVILVGCSSADPLKSDDAAREEYYQTRLACLDDPDCMRQAGWKP